MCKLTELFQKKKFKWPKHMKKCSTSLATKEIQVKTTLRLHFTPVRMAIIKNINNNKCWWGCGGKRKLHTLLVGMEISTTTMENSMGDPQWAKTRIAIWLSHTNLGIYQKEYMSGYNEGTCTPMFIAALFTIAKLWI
jgi:hypothetical protein